MLADEERELAVRRCECSLSRLVARQEGVRDLAELRDIDELIQSVETVDTATSSSAFSRAFEPSAEMRHGIEYNDNPVRVTFSSFMRLHTISSIDWSHDHLLVKPLCSLIIQYCHSNRYESVTPSFGMGLIC